jgi:hypothetical protein
MLSQVTKDSQTLLPPKEENQEGIDSNLLVDAELLKKKNLRCLG